MDLKFMVYRVEYDTVHKGLHGTTATEEADGAEFLVVNGAKIQVFRRKEPANVSWGKTGAEYLCVSTGVFTQKEKAELHLASSAEKVIISAPLWDAVPIFVVGTVAWARSGP